MPQTCTGSMHGNGVIMRQETRGLTWDNGRFVAKTETKAPPGRQSAVSRVTHRPRSAAVEVGFEPTEGLPLNTLSSTAHHCSPPSMTVPDQHGQAAADTGERPRTGVNETKTEPRA
jgi:hypothetical protein